MRPARITTDTNAHIENLRCSINVEEDASRAVISFDNLGYGTITAIKLNATGYNSFGDIVPVNGKDSFFIIVQDIKIEKNAPAMNLKAQLPSRDMRTLALEECQICYAGGSIVTYAGRNELEIETEEFEDFTDNEREILAAIQDTVASEIKYLPKAIEDGWLCGCGRFNTDNCDHCTACGTGKELMFKISNPAFVAAACEKHKQNEIERQECARTAARQKEAEQKKRNLLIALGIVAAIVLAIFIGRTAVRSGRKTYPSAKEMKAALQGSYTCYDSLGNASRQIVISGDKLIYRYRYTDDMDVTIKEWDYKGGKIITFKDLIVTREGDIKDGDSLFKKGGYLSKSNSTIPNYSYENGYSVLQITVDRVTSNAGYTICTGSVKNTGNKTYKFIEVKGSFQDASGNVIDTDWTYAAGSEGLAPDESTTFRLSVLKNSKIVSCSVRLLDFD